MITKFSVSNFKGFNESFVFDLQKTNGYEFNTESIKNGVVNHAIIYGRNGVGKSNLGLAMFDIVRHLTDKQREEEQYQNYLNGFNDLSTANFQYEFLIDSNIINYNYQKNDVGVIVSEKFSINGKVLAKIDRKIGNQADINFKGTETLNKELTNENLSLLNYIKNNAQLENNKEKEILYNFFNFIDKMLFFKSLDSNMYLGLEIGNKDVFEDIIEKDNINDLERFLNTAGIECELIAIDQLPGKTIAFHFNYGQIIPFSLIASTGTISLVIFYFWLQRLKEKSTVSFVFIDEFDAFYHHELSRLIVEELKKTGAQFVLTTHNTSIISNDLLRPDCYFLMNKNSIKSLAKSTPKELREAHNIEKMYKAGSFHV